MGLGRFMWVTGMSAGDCTWDNGTHQLTSRRATCDVGWMPSNKWKLSVKTSVAAARVYTDWCDLNMTSWFARYSNLIWFIISLKFSILISLLGQVVMAAVTHEHGVNLRHGAHLCCRLQTGTQTSYSRTQLHRDGTLLVSQRNCRNKIQPNNLQVLCIVPILQP